MQAGPKLARARARLLRRAVALGHAITADPALELAAMGRPVALRRSGALAVADLPPGAGTLSLRSRRWVPAQMHPHATDSRRLGIAVRRLWLDRRQASLDSPGFLRGWHAVEGDLRWSDGDGVLAVPDWVRQVAFETVPMGSYWATPPHARRGTAALSVPAGVDEMVDGGGRLRPHWRAVLGAYAALADDLPARAARLDQAAEEDGIASLLPGSDGTARAWRPDPLPLPLPAAEFAALEAGLIQRAGLIEAVLADLYGPQRLLAEGVLPPALVFANPGFLRPCRDLGPAARLMLYAADLVRGPDGRLDGAGRPHRRALGPRHRAREPAPARPRAARAVPADAGAPAPPVLRAVAGQPATAARRAARGQPAVALLTPGVGHPHWFEHMLLSRDLGCALVEPGDLTVRGGALFLKTLRGLQPVDVLLRRMDGRLLDPLELDGGTVAGMPGLLDAARAGAVSIVNHPGTGLAEAPGLAAFLPALAERLLGAPLALPQVPTLWLGERGGAGTGGGGAGAMARDIGAGRGGAAADAAGAALGAGGAAGDGAVAGAGLCAAGDGAAPGGAAAVPGA